MPEPRRCERCSPGSLSSSRIDERVKHTDPELARVLAARIDHRRHVRLIDRYDELGDVAVAELSGLQRDLPQLGLLRPQRELIHGLAAELDRHLLRLAEHAAWVIDVQVEQTVFL